MNCATCRGCRPCIPWGQIGLYGTAKEVGHRVVGGWQSGHVGSSAQRDCWLGAATGAELVERRPAGHQLFTSAPAMRHSAATGSPRVLEGPGCGSVSALTRSRKKWRKRLTESRSLRSFLVWGERNRGEAGGWEIRDWSPWVGRKWDRIGL